MPVSASVEQFADEATDFYYNSETSESGVFRYSDLHTRVIIGDRRTVPRGPSVVRAGFRTTSDDFYLAGVEFLLDLAGGLHHVATTFYLVGKPRCARLPLLAKTWGKRPESLRDSREPLHDALYLS